MNCLKCGREISDEDVFCVDCQLDAQRFPIDPGAAVYLPKRTAVDAAKKQPRRRTVPMEEQVKILRKRVRSLTVALLVTVGLVLALLYPAVAYVFTDHYKLGQNYTPMTTIPAATEAAE